jgi:hypothetical protein
VICDDGLGRRRQRNERVLVAKDGAVLAGDLLLLFADIGPQLVEFEPTGPDADHHAVVQLGTATTNKRGITTARGKEWRNVQVAAVLARMAT